MEYPFPIKGIAPPLPAPSVVHLSGGDSKGGAGRGALWLHEGLRALGVDSRIVFRRAELDKRRSEGSFRTSAGAALGRIALSANWRLSAAVKAAGPRDYAFAPLRLAMPHDSSLLAGADVVHVHWVSDGSFDISHLAAGSRPMVVTLRDMWPFTGGCGYDLDCERYRGACAPCPAVKPWARNWLALWRQHKARGGDNGAALRRVRFVAISDWLRDTARSSAVLGDCEVITIPNAIDIDCFHPVDSGALRRELGIAEREQVVLAGSLYLDAGYKNLASVVALWRTVAGPGRKLVLFGDRGEFLRRQLPEDVIFLGPIDGAARMREIYSLADVFVSPSLQEAFGKTAAEAAACGAPVVAFEHTGTADIVRHGETGLLATGAGSSDPEGGGKALAVAVEEILAAGGRHSPMGPAARAWSTARFSNSVIAERYLELYREIVETF